jgi:hypothetical protein
MIIYLYVKTHKITGLKYLGKTKNPNPSKYSGSGKRWINHLKKHGYDIETEILKECYSNDELKEWGIYYSNLWNIVNDPNWANIKPETGNGGLHTEETKNKIKLSHIGKLHSPETKEKMRQAKLGKPKSEEHRKNIKSSKILNPSFGHLGKSHSAESKEKMRTAALNMSDETKEKMRQAKLGKPMSEETKEKIRQANKGKIISEEHKQKLREAKRKNKN